MIPNSPKTISFITTVRHPLNSRDYRRVEYFLKNTLNSVASQTSDDFDIIVVCNKIPDYRHQFSQTTFLEVDFAPPAPTGGPATGMDAIRLDRGTKHAIALAHFYRHMNSRYFMFFDADDLLNRGIAAHLQSHAPAHGFYVENGFSLSMGRKTLNRLAQFYQVNGNANIMRSSLFSDRFSGLAGHATQTEIMDHLGQEFVFKILGSHKFTREFMQQQGTPMEPLPLPGGIWVLGTLENHSDYFGSMGNVPITQELIDTFTIPPGYLTLRWTEKIALFRAKLGKLYRRTIGDIA